MRHELNQARVDQNARGNRVEHAVDQQRSAALGGEALPDTQADGDGDRRGDAVSEREEVGRPALGRWPWDFCEAGAETETFEGLVEDEHDVEGDELLAGDGERQADEDGVEDDAEFEDEDGCELCRVGFRDHVLRFPVRREFRIGHVIALVAEVVVAADVGVRWGGFDVLGSRFTVLEAQVVAVDGAVAVAVCVALALAVRVVVIGAKVAVPHDHEFEEEHCEDGHEGDTLDPGVTCDDTGETLVSQSLVCWCEQMDECCSDNDA